MTPSHRRSIDEHESLARVSLPQPANGLEKTSAGLICEAEGGEFHNIKKGGRFGLARQC